MVKLNRIYTKGGDGGETSLGDGARRPKDDLRVAAYGDADELGATVGLAAAFCEDPALMQRLRRVQNDLFDLGADLCLPSKEGEGEGSVLRLREDQVARLETEIDEINAALPALESFVLSGGTAVGAHLHLARCVARRCERSIVSLMSSEDVSPIVLRYINRLSDWLFVMARHANGGMEILWRPGGGQGESD
ncbi:MAG TPA: cob(I)yrinic acid a,c-diamide adenosyltransferase [Planctomycetes bacterium]|nr:cob(I)yrinic acid a,c-diamide adenosyltransferase [Planctomycetota bacterium]